jgi:hypothetical protein
LQAKQKGILKTVGKIVQRRHSSRLKLSGSTSLLAHSLISRETSHISSATCKAAEINKPWKPIYKQVVIVESNSAVGAGAADHLARFSYAD